VKKEFFMGLEAVEVHPRVEMAGYLVFPSCEVFLHWLEGIEKQVKLFSSSAQGDHVFHVQTLAHNPWIVVQR